MSTPTLLPIAETEDSSLIYEAVNRLIANARSDYDLEVRLGHYSATLIAGLDRYYRGEWTVAQVVDSLNKMVPKNPIKRRNRRG